jgi:type I site-specific restriction endonuclease
LKGFGDFQERFSQLPFIHPATEVAGYTNKTCRRRLRRASESPELESQIIKGRIDVLLLRDEFWVLVVEAKEKGFSLENAIAQALTYMMTAPNPEQPVYGFATNGSEFIFLKTVQNPTPQYALSDLFTLRRQHNELYAVLQILKAIEERNKN